MIPVLDLDFVSYFRYELKGLSPSCNTVRFIRFLAVLINLAIASKILSDRVFSTAFLAAFGDLGPGIRNHRRT